MFLFSQAFVFTLPACSNVTDTKAPTSATSTGSSNYKAPDMPDYMEHEPPAGMGFDISNEDIFEKGLLCSSIRYILRCLFFVVIDKSIPIQT
jgi:hypothetical protein